MCNPCVNLVCPSCKAELEFAPRELQVVAPVVVAPVVAESDALPPADVAPVDPSNA